MPKIHTDVPLVPGAVTALTPGDPKVSARVQARGAGSVLVQATVANVAPTPAQMIGGLECQGGYTAGLDAGTPLSTHFPGVLDSGQAGYLWGLTQSRDMLASVSCA